MSLDSVFSPIGGLVTTVIFIILGATIMDCAGSREAGLIAGGTAILAAVLVTALFFLMSKIPLCWFSTTATLSTTLAYIFAGHVFLAHAETVGRPAAVVSICMLLPAFAANLGTWYYHYRTFLNWRNQRAR